MKKFIEALFIITLIITLVGCSSESNKNNKSPSAGNETIDTSDENDNTSEEDDDTSKENDDSTSTKGEKTLIVYYSHTGTTKAIAGEIQEITGGDVFEITLEEPYPEDNDAFTERVKKEIEEDARPAIANTIDDMDEYDTVFIGYPIWYQTVPMVINTFMETYDLSGKTVIPFSTSASTDIEETMEAINERCKDSTILKGLTANDPALIEPWLNEIGIINTTESSTQDNTKEQTNILVAYFTVPETSGVDASSSASRVIDNDEIIGSTQYIAQIIRDATSGDLFEIKTVQSYPGSHDALVDFAAEEQDDNARPELSTHVENIESYDYIFIGYPNWWADLPMPLYSFLEEYDFGGKTIIPFTTHGGSGLSNTINTIVDLQPEATVIDNGLSISRNNVTGAKSDVENWLKDIGLFRQPAINR